MLPPEEQYVCPGEDYAISRAVHLSRLAAFYPKCRECVHRHDSAQVIVSLPETKEVTGRRAAKSSLFTTEGVRGVYLNELTAVRAGEIAGAFASLLWERTPLEIRDPNEAAPVLARRTGPQVVVAHDDRPHSPDIVTGVAKILRRMGCQVIDIGLATRPCFWFAVDHLKAAAGIQVAGFGYDPAWTGMDFVGAGAVPVEQGCGLTDLADLLTEGYQRPMRQGAGQRTFHSGPVYEAGLRKHFHALRPLKICVGCANRPVRDVLNRLFQTLACKLILVPIPVRARKIHDPEDVDAQRIGSAVLQNQAHFGLLVDDDGQTCSVFDEQGRMVAAQRITLLLAELVLQEARDSRIILESSVSQVLTPEIERRSGLPTTAESGRGNIAIALRESEAIFAGGESGRYWFQESMPVCDAVLTLVKLLQALSRSDADLSEVIARL